MNKFGTAVVVGLISSALLFIATCIYYVGLSDVLPISGYDAHRFFSISNNGDTISILTWPEMLLVSLITTTTLFSTVPFIGIYLLLLSVASLSLMGYPWKRLSIVAVVCPAFSFFLETGKDVFILASLLVLVGFLGRREKIFNLPGHVKLCIYLILSLLLSLALLIKGLTFIVYIPLIFAIPLARLSMRRFFYLLVLLFAFILASFLRPYVDLEVIEDVSRFSSSNLVTTSVGLEHILKSFLRFPVYLFSPAWYFLAIYISNADKLFPMLFHVWSYLLCSIYFFRYGHWRDSAVIYAALLFSISYPFIHLRYFFVWYAVYCVAVWLRPFGMSAKSSHDSSDG